MILIIESGSTKSDWVLVENGEISNSYKTMGFNPFFHNETIIFNSIRQNSDLRKIAKTVSQVFFYGAGCSSVELNSIVQKAFSRFFINATINVDHDLLAWASGYFFQSIAVAYCRDRRVSRCFRKATDPADCRAGCSSQHLPRLISGANRWMSPQIKTFF